MFDITAKEIGELTDTDLRVLVARLCEKQIREARLPISSVIAGGDQRAKDGGLDVRVDLPSTSPSIDFIPKYVTGFQVKQENQGFARKKILKEMRPNGVVRPVLEELAGAGGAYIIVSGRETPSVGALSDRRLAMREAVKSVAISDSLTLDFYGGDRLAQWINQYPGLVAWVLDRLGRPFRGWRSFGSWASSKEAPDSEYLLDRTARLFQGSQRDDVALPIEEGLSRVRKVLAQPGTVVRLVGLSGTGKTRFVQALFDERVGKNTLDCNDAVYTDIAYEPEPAPREMIDRLVADCRRAILIIDNCPPSTHRVLASAMGRHSAAISLITIEFDVGEDEPEITEVFRLEAASPNVISELVKRRVPQISQPDRQRIANLSGGNARLALALAGAVRSGVDTSKLTDADLFDRLFYQRQNKDPALLVTAEVSALVYSFDGTMVEGNESELSCLAELANQSVDEFYRHIAQLTDRDLVQHRGRWRALLPHGLAIYLAHRALSHISIERVCSIMEQRAPIRLLQSFTRRLGYLHDSQDAQKIVSRWLAQSGQLCNISNLTPTGRQMLQNVAPVNPAAVLTAIEMACERDDSKALLAAEQSNRHSLISVLRSIAYEPILFSRAAMLLARFWALEPPDNRNNSAESDFKELFHITLSGTHASIEQRIDLARNLIEGSNDRAHQCGLVALDELLEASRFSSSHDFSFGGRVRDFGWRPKKLAEMRHWYRQSLSYAVGLATSSGRSRDKARSILASNFRGLWSVRSIRGLILTQFRAIAEAAFWPEGWIAIQTTINFDGKSMSHPALKRLRCLERQFRPRELIEKARAYVLTKAWGALDVADAEEQHEGEELSAKYDRIDASIRHLGREAAGNENVLQALLPEVVNTDVGRVRPFGAGLADGASNLDSISCRIVVAMAATAPDKRDVGLLQGFLVGAAERNLNWVNAFLDKAVRHPTLGALFALLQVAVPIDSGGLRRLNQSVELGLAPAWSYSSLAIGRVCDELPSEDFVQLILRIAGLSDGYSVAVLILAMRIHSAKSIEAPLLDNDIRKCGQILLDRVPPTSSDSMLDHRLSEIAKACLNGDDSSTFARDVCRRIRRADDPWFDLHQYQSFITSILQVQPFAALDEFVGDGSDKTSLRILADSFSSRNSLSATVPIKTLLDWAMINPSARFPALAAVIGLFPHEGNQDVINPVAIELLSHAPDKRSVLAQFERSIEPHSWMGSMATVLEKRLAQLREFSRESDPAVNEWVNEMEMKLSQSISYWREYDKREDETFE